MSVNGLLVSRLGVKLAHILYVGVIGLSHCGQGGNIQIIHRSTVGAEIGVEQFCGFLRVADHIGRISVIPFRCATDGKLAHHDVSTVHLQKAYAHANEFLHRNISFNILKRHRSKLC
ncbi:hypothetical protein EVA_09136 [gut metagenome]|uniref:Uncharacterized protein n=1 Tax=gut metagenome TaxID=749906 RepID=J9G6A2_9ZZZZ